MATTITFPAERREQERQRFERFAAFFNRYVDDDIGIFRIPGLTGFWRAVPNEAVHPWRHRWAIVRVSGA